LKIDSARLNILIGKNDSGKSNLLKAINLFFNNQTDFRTAFRFEDDFCKFAQVASKKAKEITISLEIVPPASYTLKDGQSSIVWEKKWRSEGLHSETIGYADKSELENRSRIPSWLSKYRFRYVPAIKGTEYFQQLLKDLHDVLSETIDVKIKEASASFIDAIQKNTTGISESLESTLQIKSTIQLPSDLRELFSTLDFQTVKNDAQISLNQRGDGIKTRHIPIILKFLSDQETAFQQQGSPTTTHIWGYEEPENNLELSATFALGGNFLNYCPSIQIFTTTHSPGVYTRPFADSTLTSTCKAIAVVYDEEVNSSVYNEITDNLSAVDESMGLMPLVAPYIAEKEREFQHVLSLLNTNAIKKNRIAVEGPNDETILMKAFEVFAPEVKTLIDAGSLFFEYNRDGNGCNEVANQVRANALFNNANYKIFALFDNDQAAIETKRTLDKESKVVKARTSGFIKTRTLDKPPHLKADNIRFFFAMEELVKIDTWNYADRKGWLEERNNINDLCNIVPHPNKSGLDSLIEKGFLEANSIYVLKKVRNDRKRNFSNYISSLPDHEAIIQLEYFKNLAIEINDFFK